MIALDKMNQRVKTPVRLPFFPSLPVTLASWSDLQKAMIIQIILYEFLILASPHFKPTFLEVYANTSCFPGLLRGLINIKPNKIPFSMFPFSFLL